MPERSSQTITNFLWRFLERCGAQGVTFVVSIVLARLLDPAVYGTIALVNVFTVIMQVFIDSGFGCALIQKKDADSTDFSTVFYFNIAVCTLLYAVMFVSAPAIASFYDRAELVPIVRVMSLSLIISGVKNVQQAYVSRNMLFKKFFFATLGGTVGAAVVGIVMKVFQIVISIVIGMAAGCIPIVGFNMGAGRRDRVRKLFTRLLWAEAVVGLAALAVAELLPGQLIAIFGAKNESVYYTEFAVKAFRVYLCMLPLACVNKAVFIFLQAMGKAVASTLLSMAREIVFGVGFAVLLPVFFGLDGVLYSMPVSDVLTALLSALLIVMTYKQLPQKE